MSTVYFSTIIQNSGNFTFVMATSSAIVMSMSMMWFLFKRVTLEFVLAFITICGSRYCSRSEYRTIKIVTCSDKILLFDFATLWLALIVLTKKTKK